jgi:RNA recognition motif-containing protein
MAAKLYVGGLPYSVTDDALKQSFSQAGTVVSASVIMDKFTNRSKGFGFVEMSSDEEAKAAIAMFDGKDYEGRILKVNEARPMEPRENRSFGGGGRSGGFGGGGRSFGGGGRSGGFGGGNRGGGRGDDRGGRDW